MGELAVAAKITHVPSMYLSEWPGDRHGTRRPAGQGLPGRCDERQGEQHHALLLGGRPDELRVEKGFSPDTLDMLRARGHRIVIRPTRGKTQTIQRHQGRWYGASDPRNPDGLTLGY